MKQKKPTVKRTVTTLLMLMAICLSSFAQKIAISGKVVDTNGEELIGASVFVKGNTATGTVSDLSGEFKLNVPSENSTGVVSYVGMVTKEFKGLVRGEYGRTPVPISDEFVKKIVGDESVITCRPADLLKPELETLRKEAAQWLEQDEDVLSYAQFGQVAVKFFEKRRNRLYGIDGEHVDFKAQVHPV